MGRVELSLIRGFRVVHEGTMVSLPLGAQRVLAFLALHDRPVLRAAVAGTLWQDAAERRACASLRSALWRLNQPGLRLVDATVTSLCLAPHVRVDLQRVEELAHDVLSRRVACEAMGRPAQSFRGDFLPDWPDDWVLIERERFRQLRLHVLEALCDQLTEVGRFGEAVDAGLAAVAAEPLRESAHRAVMRAYLAEGNRGEALRQYDLYRQLAQTELGVAPSAVMRALVANTAAPDPRDG
ncbi:BTAD domain-containing putative transcriptional regulator [Pseudonocardia sp. DSM 45834]|uniref:BTAD domain-containing putative transcriptional regulator n=1 Tax=Pseudonocardia charpentierae TaxID=3075545 RepID=A0ABU2NGP6_9PSEU|nr:BTAD domain-containing putative transcriptional regulator [Pseudonocardia sp. DSM 45834]